MGDQPLLNFLVHFGDFQLVRLTELGIDYKCYNPFHARGSEPITLGEDGNYYEGERRLFMLHWPGRQKLTGDFPYRQFRDSFLVKGIHRTRN